LQQVLGFIEFGGIGVPGKKCRNRLAALSLPPGAVPECRIWGFLVCFGRKKPS